MDANAVFVVPLGEKRLDGQVECGSDRHLLRVGRQLHRERDGLPFPTIVPRNRREALISEPEIHLDPEGPFQGVRGNDVSIHDSWGYSIYSAYSTE